MAVSSSASQCSEDTLSESSIPDSTMSSSQNADSSASSMTTPSLAMNSALERPLQAAR